MAIPSILQKIAAHKRAEVAARKAACPVISLAGAPPVRDFTAALRRDSVALIAEVKQASPSRGVMRSDFDPVDLARVYAGNGAACLSVLTDEAFFRGSDAHLRAVRRAVSVPVLRKEFILDPWQIAESRLLGADAILLIAALLTPEEMRSFQAQAQALGMAALVEVHTAEEAAAALAIDPPLVGINNRDLHTFETSLAATERLAGQVLAGGERLLVSESGIATAEDAARAARAGARAVLVGEALVREADVAAKVRELSGVPIAEAVR